jgi:hypothetical protein
MATFVPGLRLCSAFFADAVQPLLANEFSGLLYAAARVGPGSEVTDVGRGARRGQPCYGRASSAASTWSR